MNDREEVLNHRTRTGYKLMFLLISLRVDSIRKFYFIFRNKKPFYKSSPLLSHLLYHRKLSVDLLSKSFAHKFY